MKLRWILVLLIAAAAPLMAADINMSMANFETYKDIGYDQVYRPQFHFTSRKNWINDPNGMLYYKGEYHLFFQHNPKALPWGNMTWGHAISKDMVQWKQINHAILPYNRGTIYSGTGFVDHNNSLKKQEGKEKTLVACFTFAREPFYQAIAYSTDKGRTFTLLNDGQAVVPNQGFNKGERDPKVFWHKASKKWVMVLWVKRGKPGKVRFFNSDNLVDWKHVSDFDRDWVFECMDLVELPIDGNKRKKKWLLYDASFDYEIGTFDGKRFNTNRKVGAGDYGWHYYAAQTFNNSPDGRTIIIGWMRGSKFADKGMPFNQQMSFPATMTLRTTPNGLHLYRWPIKEISNLYTSTRTLSNLSPEAATEKLADFEAELVDVTVEFEPRQSKTVTLTVRGYPLTYNVATKAFVGGYFNKIRNHTLPAPLVKGKVSLRVLVDRGSIEMFANHGYAVATTYLLPDAKNKGVSVAADGNARITKLTVNALKSSWGDQ